MFRHLVRTRLKCIIRARSILFWSLAFPIILAILFKVSLGGVTQGASVDCMPIAIIQQETQESAQLKVTLETLSREGQPVFDVIYTSKEHAESLLESEKVVGIIEGGKLPKLIVRDNGIEESMLKVTLDAIIQQQKVMIDTVQQGQQQALAVPKETDVEQGGAVSKVRYTKEVTLGKHYPDTFLNYFFALMGMACLFASFLGLGEVVAVQGNQTKVAARLNTAPISKEKQFFAGYLAVICVQSGSVLLLVWSLIKVLKVDLGEEVGLVVLTLLVGSIMAIVLGGFVGSIGTFNADIKGNILTCITMLGAILSGLVQCDTPYMVAQYIPWLRYVNPVALIRNSLYSLYYYEDYSEYLLNMGFMGIFIVGLSLGTYKMIRRRCYVSI